MNKKLYFYSTILAIAYTLFVGHRLYEGSQSFVSGFKAGYSHAKEAHDQRKVRSEMFVCGGSLTPVDGSATFPTSFLNLKTGEEISIEITQMIAKLSQKPDVIPAYVVALDVVKNLLTFVLFGLFIYLPFVVYRIMKSISSNTFYSVRNINKIRKVSLIVLGIFLANLLATVCLVITTNTYMQIEGYKASVKDFDYSLLFLGLVVLVLSEILRYTTSMKEEQELTI
ncbi:MAG: DUF2975 domain-containing protein [Dysgonamonadaceae bacterium]|jgi:hypothetical protein|nr:DUF2975 domain-containing protein [Dysgonamonadaceae bacterium]